eukprot:2476248-Pleurochrysis_carterae.AAC.1
MFRRISRASKSLSTSRIVATVSGRLPVAARQNKAFQRSAHRRVEREQATNDSGEQRHDGER